MRLESGMGMPRVGQPFPDFELGDFSSRSARSEGPLFVVVWRTECSTSRLAMPFYERMRRAYPAARFVGIIQNRPDEAEQYCAANGIAMTTLPDDHLTITRFLAIDTVPHCWLVASDGAVLLEGIGWNRATTEAIAERTASLTGAFYGPVVRDDDGVPAFKPG